MPARKPPARKPPANLFHLVASADGSIQIDAAATTTPATIQAADYTDAQGRPKPATFKANVYAGGPINPTVHGSYSTGGTPIVLDLATARVNRNGRKLPILYGHDRGQPIGHTDRVDLGPSSITAEGTLSIPSPTTDQIVGGSANGFSWAVSMGASSPELEYISQSDTVTVNGRNLKGPLYVARRATVREISLLPIGADPSASATVSATLTAAPTEEGNPMPPELRAHIEAAGFSPDDLNDAQIEHFRATLEASASAAGDDTGNGSADANGSAGTRCANVQPAAGDATITAAAADTATQLQAMRAEIAAEARRSRRIAEICAAHGSPSITIQGRAEPLQAIAIEAGWDETKTELEAMRASRPSAPGAHSTGRSQTVTLASISAGLAMRCGVAIDSAGFRSEAAIEAGLPEWITAGLDSKTFNEAATHGRRFREASLMEIAASAVEVETGTRPHGRRAVIEAAFSSNAFSRIFGTTIGARALMAFNESPDTTRGWTQRGTLPDFETHDRVGMDAMESMDYLPPGGDAKHAKRADFGETVQAARYAKQYVIDEQDLIGDRLDLLQRSPMAMGRAAGRLVPDLVYGLLLANPTMTRTSRAAFHVTDGTLLSSAAFAAASLSTGIASLMKQKDGDASLGLMPTHLIVPPELADAAVAITGSVFIGEDSGQGTQNPLARYGLQVVADPRLSNGVVHPKTKTLQAGSTTAWYLASTQGETIEVQTVEGTGGVPVVRVSNLTQGKWGLHVDAKFDVGAKILENRTMRKNAGT